MRVLRSAVAVFFQRAQIKREKIFGDQGIGHFGRYHNTLCLSRHILHKHCFQFLLGHLMVSRENKNNGYAKFGGTNKEYYGIFRSGLLDRLVVIFVFPGCFPGSLFCLRVKLSTNSPQLSLSSGQLSITLINAHELSRVSTFTNSRSRLARALRYTSLVCNVCFLKKYSF